MSIPAIETRYADHLFRSRLEARWAALFDLIGWDWIYEPFDGVGYVPDFLLQGKSPVVVEVKPDTTLEELRRHSDKIDVGLPGWTGDVLIVGSVPSMPTKYEIRRATPAIGLLGEGGTRRIWNEGAWQTCYTCGQIGFAQSVQNFICRPCGHDGGGPGGPMFNLKELWGQAHEATRWSP